MINLDSISKSRDITLPTKVHLVKSMVFPIVMYGCESWTVKKAERGQVTLSSQCQVKDFGLYSGCIREGLGQFVPRAQVKAVMPYPELCILALSLLVPGFPGGSDGKESAYNE